MISYLGIKIYWALLLTLNFLTDTWVPFSESSFLYYDVLDRLFCFTSIMRRSACTYIGAFVSMSYLKLFWTISGAHFWISSRCCCKISIRCLRYSVSSFSMSRRSCSFSSLCYSTSRFFCSSMFEVSF